MASTHSKGTAVSAAVTASANTKELPTLDLSAASSWRPKQVENTTPLPMHRPSRMEVRNVISVKDEPTPASAPAPTDRPTTHVSTTLYACCKTLPSSMGSAKSDMVANTLPCDRSFCIVLSFKYFFL